MGSNTRNASQWVERCASQMELAGVYFGHGTDNAADEAAWMVSRAMDLDPASPLDGDMQVTQAAAKRIEHVLLRRTNEQIPLAYIFEEAWFCGRPFKVDKNVLIPRSPIGELICHGFEPWVDMRYVTTVLDLCTGSGAIGISTALEYPEVVVDASDISEAALRVAHSNVQLHELTKRVHLHHSDLFAQLQDRRWDLILTNPPYVAAQSMENLPAEYLAEPELALVSAMEGLELPLSILATAADHLTEKGVLICEVGESMERLQELLPDVPFIWLEFEHGGEGVFTIGRNELRNHAASIRKLLE